MRTTLDIPQALILDAMNAAGKKTKTAVIIAALEELVSKSKIQGIKKFKGKVDLQMDLNRLRNRV